MGCVIYNRFHLLLIFAQLKKSKHTFGTLGSHSIAFQHHTEGARSIGSSSDVPASSATKLAPADRAIGNSRLSRTLLSFVEQLCTNPPFVYYLFTICFLIIIDMLIERYLL